MLRVTIGSEVEALSKKFVDAGAWVCAKVTKISAYTYTVNYGSPDGKIIEETVPRISVRPVPPPLQGVANFTAGDIVECCHNFFWQTAKIFRALTGSNFFQVLLFGDSGGFVVHRSFLRVRQRWTGGGWCVVGKKSPTQYIEKRICAFAKRKPCEDYSPIKKGIAGGRRKRRRLDEEEDRESVGSNSVGDESKRDDEAESVSTKRRIHLDRDHITYVSDDDDDDDDKDFATIMDDKADSICSCT